MKKTKFKFSVSFILAIVLALTSFYLTPWGGMEAYAAEENSKIVQAGETVTIVQEKGSPFSFFWTAPKAGYFNFSFTNRKSTKGGESYYTPRCKFTVKLDGKIDAASGDYDSFIEQSGYGEESMYFNCNKGTKVEITYQPDYDDGTLTSDFKLNFTAPKNAVGLKNKSKKTATKIKLNKTYTTVARQDPIHYTREGDKYSYYNELKMNNIDMFNKHSRKYDLDWYKFKAPKEGYYLFTTKSTVTVFVTNSKGKCYMAGNSQEYSNKVKLNEYVRLKKGETAYFIIVPNELDVPDKTMGTKFISDGFLYTVKIRRK